MKAVYLRPYSGACEVEVDYNEPDLCRFIDGDITITELNGMVVVSDVEADEKKLAPCTIIEGVQFCGDVLIIKRSDIKK